MRFDVRCKSGPFTNTSKASTILEIQRAAFGALEETHPEEFLKAWRGSPGRMMQGTSSPNPRTIEFFWDDEKNHGDRTQEGTPNTRNAAI